MLCTCEKDPNRPATLVIFSASGESEVTSIHTSSAICPVLESHLEQSDIQCWIRNKYPKVTKTFDPLNNYINICDQA